MCYLLYSVDRPTQYILTKAEGKTKRERLLIGPSILGLIWVLQELGCVYFLSNSTRIVDVHFPNIG